jgi:hypothetical protein
MIRTTIKISSRAVLRVTAIISALTIVKKEINDMMGIKPFDLLKISRPHEEIISNSNTTFPAITLCIVSPLIFL